MSRKRTLNQAREEFLAYYHDKLPLLTLETYLAKRNPPILLVSPKYESKVRALFEQVGLTWDELDWFPHAIHWPPEIQLGTLIPGFEYGWVYSMNEASLKPVAALNAKRGESILDVCAAPGGKSAAILAWSEPQLTANDPSFPRYKRLRTVLKHFGYPRISVLNKPAQALTYIVDQQFDKILLDAPCSSEKHVFNSKKHLRIWSPKRVTKLAHLQKLLLASVWPLLKPGGTLVYSTCALSPEENEMIVADYPQASTPQRFNEPDSSLDPMFVSVLRKPIS